MQRLGTEIQMGEMAKVGCQCGKPAPRSARDVDTTPIRRRPPRNQVFDSVGTSLKSPVESVASSAPDNMRIGGLKRCYLRTDRRMHGPPRKWAAPIGNSRVDHLSNGRVGRLSSRLAFHWSSVSPPPSSGALPRGKPRGRATMLAHECFGKRPEGVTLMSQ